MASLDSVDWAAVRGHYDDRVSVSKTMLQLYKQTSVEKFANLALGISDVDGNYSAAEHSLGPQIPYPDYNRNAAQRVFDLAGDFISLTEARSVPEQIKQRAIKLPKNRSWVGNLVHDEPKRLLGRQHPHYLDSPSDQARR